jgi:hypothetical protein
LVTDGEDGNDNGIDFVVEKVAYGKLDYVFKHLKNLWHPKGMINSLKKLKA